MTGAKESPAKDKLNHVEKLLEEYQTRKGIIPLKPKSDVDTYLNMPQEQMRKIPPEECAEAGIILTRYAAYLQDAYNTEIGRVHWAEEQVRRTITPDIKQYAVAYQSFDERRQLAIMGNEYTSELDNLRVWAQALADRLNFMANRVDSIARAYLALATTKRK